ncbi:MAG: 50S ribosomal protein L29 [Ardenticatenaceae bacterium]|nr:50S ribosomal protein L29 [Ardenticatenaceae bacterium]MCB8946963.1 50S ribosomal protein L29 [Ardenticatenaceae bacterium]
MANIVELREMSEAKLEEMLENNREEMYNLRFLKASAQLEDYSRIKIVRREIAQLETVLNMRQLAIETAVADEAVASALAGKEWEASARYNYEDSGWQVTFTEGGKELASALVNLNKKRAHSRRQANKTRQSQRVVSAEVAG